MYVAGAAANYAEALKRTIVDMRKDLQLDPDGILSGRDLQKAPTLSVKGAFFAGQQYDAFRLVDGLISGATKTLEIVDRFFDKAALELLEAKQPAVSLRVLVGAQKAKAAVIAVRAFNQQAASAGRPGIELHESDAVHDRFLIVDGTQYYHFGTSFNSLGTRGFMFSRVEDSAVVNVVRGLIDAAWAKGPDLL